MMCYYLNVHFQGQRGIILLQRFKFFAKFKIYKAKILKIAATNTSGHFD